MTPAADVFLLVRSALESAGVRYAVGGSWASAAFGEPRFTNDIDILADLTVESLDPFFRNLSEAFMTDPDDARTAIRLGRPFNVIYVPAILKFDFFPARAFPLGLQELDRAVPIADSQLSETPIRFVTPEDILLAKLHWFKSGGEVSEVQWRDIRGILKRRATTLDRDYLRQSAMQLGVTSLLERAFREP